MRATQEKLMAMRALAFRVKRYHTFETLHTETVGEHTARVMSLYIQFFGLPRAEVLEYILHHDLGELHAGDMPFIAKRVVPELKEFMDLAEERGRGLLGIPFLPDLTSVEYARFKLCDILQMLEFALLEIQMGNTLAWAIKENVMAALDKLEGLPTEQVKSGTLAILTGVPLGGEDD